MTLLFIDTAVAEYEKIVVAAQPTVTTVLFDRAVDTFTSLKDKITAALNGAQAGAVGIVQHGSTKKPLYKMLEAQVTPAIITDANVSDPTLQSWSELIDFYSFLKSCGATTVDLISCALYANAGWVYVLQQLESKLGLNFRASINNTGNISSGGDWIQESDGVNIQTIYFTENISEYVNLLSVVPKTPSPQPARPTVRDGAITYNWLNTDPTTDVFELTLQSDNSSIIVNIDWNINEYTFQGLTQGNTYTASLVAKNVVGSSLPATYLPAQLCAPPSEPQTVIFRKVGSNGVEVSWRPPAFENGGTIQGYLLYNNDSENRRPRYSIEPYKTEHIQVDIQPGTYTWAIAAYNSAGFGLAFIDGTSMTFS